MDNKDRELSETVRMQRFEELYRMFYRYVYEYKVGYKDDFKVDVEDYRNNVNRTNFEELLDEQGMIIKVCDGY